MTAVVVSGTGTEIGKTVTTAAIAAVAAAAGRRVAVVKPAQAGLSDAGRSDTEEVARLAGEDVTTVELARYPEPLAPATTARRAGLAPVRPEDVADAVAKLETEHDLVLVEGAGGLLVRFDDAGTTLADVARHLGAPVLVVASAGLGTLNVAALTAEALRARSLTPLGVVVGSWPAHPDLAARCNVTDLPAVTDAPLLGAVPEGAGALDVADFRARAGSWLAASLGGTWDAAGFAELVAPGPLGA